VSLAYIIIVKHCL